MSLWCVSCICLGEKTQAVTVVDGDAVCVRHLASAMATEQHGAAMTEERWIAELQRTMRTPEYGTSS